MNTKGKVDKIIGFFVSKKLTVFTIATVALFIDVITSSEWVLLSCIYLTAQGTADVISILKNR